MGIYNTLLNYLMMNRIQFINIIISLTKTKSSRKSIRGWITNSTVLIKEKRKKTMKTKTKSL